MNRLWSASKSALALVALSALLVGCATTGSNVSANGIAVAPSQPVNHVTYNYPDTMPATGKSVFIYDPKQYSWAAYGADGQLIRTGIGSSGRDYCSDIDSPCHTPSGTYHVYRKGGSDCESSIFPLGKGGAPMPYCMFFKGGYALHGSYDVPKYGFNASHGCVRLEPEDAQWLSQNVLNIGSTVVIRSYH